MSVTEVLRQGRAAFERRMRATCTIRRPGPVEVDPLTGESTPTYLEPPVYVGKCYTRYPGLAFEQTPEAGGFNFTVSRTVLRIPFGPVARPGDVVTIDVDPDHPAMAGTVLRAASVDDQSQATAQRILCEDFQSGVT